MDNVLTIGLHVKSHFNINLYTLCQTPLQHHSCRYVGNNFTTNVQNFATSHHLDMSRCFALVLPEPNNCCTAASSRNDGFDHVIGDVITQQKTVLPLWRLFFKY